MGSIIRVLDSPSSYSSQFHSCYSSQLFCTYGSRPNSNMVRDSCHIPFLHEISVFERALHENKKFYFFRSLKACDHWFLRNPGMHHSMHNGSIALALSTLPISSTSNPNFSSISCTFFFASSLFPQMNMVGFVSSPNSGLTSSRSEEHTSELQS